ncbi:hypothetical protein [uncultured Paracoccus sp.]|uniref:hypothetical protein n=1 Tax=uncultured Paracoccus sp. TaxID=189685 RepID=UPI002607D951|nr:hypothetical protein [uncultured Paracoccus sp.]
MGLTCPPSPMSPAVTPFGQTPAEGVAGVAQGDVVVAFGLRRRVTYFGSLLEALTANGAQILLVADQNTALPHSGSRFSISRDLPSACW